MSHFLKLFLTKYWILILLVFIKFFLQYVLVNPIYELHRDEFLHLDQANHLALGYISVPPFTSWLSSLINHLGGGLFWIRFFPAFFGAITLVIVWKTVEALGGKVYARILASCALLFSVLVRINILFQPNSFDILAWTLLFYFFIRFVQTSNSKWLYYCALVSGFGFLNKYNIVFLLIGLFVSILFTQRKIFTLQTFWKAAGLAILIVLPNVIWQFVNHFPVLEHLKALKNTQLDHNSPLGFLKGQALFFFGSLPVVLAALYALVTFRSFEKFRFIALTFVVTLSIFAFLKAKDYYALGLYPVLLAFGSVFTEKILKPGTKLIVFSLLIVFNLGLFVATARLVYPVLSPEEISENRESFEKLGLLRWEDGKNHQLPQDFADMIGWREMAEKARSAYLQIPAEELPNTLVFCDNYGQTGALNYYNRGIMKEAYSFNTDYIYWLPEIPAIKNVLLVGEAPDQEIINLFSSFQQLGRVESEFARERGTGVFLLSGANCAFTEIFYQMAKKRKTEFDIF